ncbi:hypothetical protein WH47_12597 [Habropoda laboriosa]|uniref:Uncharacterized protein n=1 Tax=Habropoda laboriosa TaxID=597456 RepID=A0A0L7R7I1_9HYME|nr:hypothetical protein WH47_12597 [Habropoda laboriosa]
MSERRISLGINVSIFVILTIFGVLLSLPLRLLLTTHYYDRNGTVCENDTLATTENATVQAAIAIPLDYRKLKRCPKFGYQDRLLSVYRCDYDGNCTYTSVSKLDGKEKDKLAGSKNETTNDRGNVTKKIATEEAFGENMTENVGDNGKNRRTKSVPVAVHILMTMLLISAIAALVEVLRIRFARDKVLKRKPH